MNDLRIIQGGEAWRGSFTVDDQGVCVSSA